jgi:hypothetical protein
MQLICGIQQVTSSCAADGLFQQFLGGRFRQQLCALCTLCPFIRKIQFQGRRHHSPLAAGLRQYKFQHLSNKALLCLGQLADGIYLFLPFRLTI